MSRAPAYWWRAHSQTKYYYYLFRVLSHLMLCPPFQVNLSVEEMQAVMACQGRIRNMSVIAHVDHGKTTLTDSLLSRAGLMAENQAGSRRATDTREDEKTKGITIKST